MCGAEKAGAAISVTPHGGVPRRAARGHRPYGASQSRYSAACARAGVGVCTSPRNLRVMLAESAAVESANHFAAHKRRSESFRLLLRLRPRTVGSVHAFLAPAIRRRGERRGRRPSRILRAIGSGAAAPRAAPQGRCYSPAWIHVGALPPAQPRTARGPRARRSRPAHLQLHAAARPACGPSRHEAGAPGARPSAAFRPSGR